MSGQSHLRSGGQPQRINVTQSLPIKLIVRFPIPTRFDPIAHIGLGAQGGDLASLAAAARSAPDVINVSRGILYAGDERGFGARAKDWAEKIAAAYPG